MPRASNNPGFSTHGRRYKGKVAFGEVLRANPELSAEFGVRGYPALLVVCGGNKDVVVKYDGEWGVLATSSFCFCAIRVLCLGLVVCRTGMEHAAQSASRDSSPGSVGCLA
jgi:hypothetical protein